MDWETHKKQLLKDPKFRKALKDSEPELQIAKAVIEARLDKGLSQQELAARLHTKQSVISRLENAKTTPSLAFLKRVAKALEVSFQVRITP
jgi:ribosome-binding protein aMBF1 (putative translation factor)